MNKDNATVIGKNKINAIERHVPHDTPSISQQAILSKNISRKLPTELQYVEKNASMKEVSTQKFCTLN